MASCGGSSGGGSITPALADQEDTYVPSSLGGVQVLVDDGNSESGTSSDESVGPEGVPEEPKQPADFSELGDPPGDTSDDLGVAEDPIEVASETDGEPSGPDDSAEESEPGASDSGVPEVDSRQEARKFYTENLHEHVVLERCIACHILGGLAENTSLNFSSDIESNFQIFIKSNGETVLRKVQGQLSHGGGAIYASHSPEVSALQTFFEVLRESEFDSLQLDFEVVTLEARTNTLRRASILLSGQVPDKQSLEAAAYSDQALRKEIRAKMRGPGFHDFLIRSANERLLTDAFANGLFFNSASAHSPWYPIHSNFRVDNFRNGDTGRAAYYDWVIKFQYGLIRSPLELIAYVVENDLPYSEILTADYKMINPQVSFAMNADIQFNNDSRNNFQPGANRGQILKDEHLSWEYFEGFGMEVYSHGDFVERPHVGILTDLVFLNRYPTTETNRNRSRARMVLAEFLDMDIMSFTSMASTTEELISQENPTLNNPYCSVCHQVLDPVAGAFQNFGVVGHFRDMQGGLNALPGSYRNAVDSPYHYGDTWFRDMRRPGFEQFLITDHNQSLRQLAGHIVQDERFARATVKFWWNALMSTQLTSSIKPQQQEIIDDLAQQFFYGSDTVNRMNLKDLLVEMVMSSWFRAETINTNEGLALDGAGAGRLLSPEELENKTHSLLGLAWGEKLDHRNFDGIWSQLRDQNVINYGGIDSYGITKRPDEMNSMMSNVAMSQALALSCPAVLLNISARPEAAQPLSDLRSDVLPSTMAFDKVHLDENSPDTIQLHLSPVETGREFIIALTRLDKHSDNQIVNSIVVEDSSGAVLAQWYKSPSPSLNALIQFRVDKSDTELIHLTIELTDAPRGSTTLGVSAFTHDGIGNAGETYIKKNLADLHEAFWGEVVLSDAPEVANSYELFTELWEMHGNTDSENSLFRCDISLESVGDHYTNLRLMSYDDPHRLLATWSTMLVYFMTDYRYLHE